MQWTPSLHSLSQTLCGTTTAVQYTPSILSLSSLRVGWCSWLVWLVLSLVLHDWFPKTWTSCQLEAGFGKLSWLVAGFGTLAALLWGFPVPTPGLDHVTSATCAKATQLKHLAVKRVQGQILFSILWEVEKKRWPTTLFAVGCSTWMNPSPPPPPQCHHKWTVL